MIKILTEKLNNERVLEKASPKRLSPILFLYLLGFILMVTGLIGLRPLYQLYLDTGNLLVVSTLGMVIAGIAALVFSEAKIRFTNYYITDKRVIKEYSFIKTKKTVLRNEKITNVKLEQSIIENILGLYTLHIFTAGKNRVHPRTMKEIGDIRISWIKSGQEINRTLNSNIKPV